MDDRFHTEDIDKLRRICCQFLGKENYSKENQRHKIQKIYFININSDNPQIHHKKSPTNVTLQCLLPSKGKVL